MNQERKKILELVQKGKLSAQEAIILLEALGEDGEKKAPINEAIQTEPTEPKQTEKISHDEEFQGTQTEEKQQHQEKNEQG